MGSVIYTAAHAGFDLAKVPLGGAAAICRLLTDYWQKQNTFPVTLLTPALLGDRAPKNDALVRYSEWQYARFCFRFEDALTQEILRHDPRRTIVLSNDISEGPRFRQLSEQGYPIYTIYHVDVVDYFARLYLGGRVAPETLARGYDRADRSRFRALLPSLLRLIFAKQRDSVLYSRGIIVPSEGMKRTLLRCYPAASPEKIHVLPWGSPEQAAEDPALPQAVKEWRERYRIPDQARVLLTLSRISPEKGQDRLLRALALWEKAGDLPPQGLWLLLCGEAAYMRGAAFKKRLEALARRLKKVQVIFTGHLSGLHKRAHFRLADLYVFPSRHESYGLTLMEAFQEGLPVVACRHYGSEDLVRPEFGELVSAEKEAEIPGLLEEAMKRLLTDPERLKMMGERAKEFAEKRKFSETAKQLGELLLN